MCEENMKKRQFEEKCLKLDALLENNFNDKITCNILFKLLPKEITDIISQYNVINYHTLQINNMNKAIIKIWCYLKGNYIEKLTKFKDDICPTDSSFLYVKHRIDNFIKSD